MSEQLYLLIAAAIGRDEKLQPFTEYRYVPFRSAENEVELRVGMISEEHDVQVMGIISKEMANGMLSAVADYTYLLIAAPSAPGQKLLPTTEFQYIPFSCDPEEINLAVSTASKQYGMQAIGVISKEMAIGMLKTMEEFEKGV